jgi:hypothetical protein
VKEFAMKTALAITLSAGVGMFATLALLSPGHLLEVLAFGLALLLASVAWKYSRPWWLPTSIFGMTGVSHLLASWWLRSQGRPSSAALQTFGPGDLLMAAWYLVRKRWFGKTPTTS